MRERRRFTRMTSQVFRRLRKPERTNYNGRQQQRLENHMFILGVLPGMFAFPVRFAGKKPRGKIAGNKGKIREASFLPISPAGNLHLPKHLVCHVFLIYLALNKSQKVYLQSCNCAKQCPQTAVSKKLIRHLSIVSAD